MKLKLFLILCISLSANAQNLSEITNSLSNSKKVQSIKDKAYADIYESKLEFSYEAPELGVSVTSLRAVSQEDESGKQYGVGISQNINQPFSSEYKNRVVNSKTKSIKQELKHELHLLNINLASLYHNTCISKEINSVATYLYDEENKRFMQFQKSYDLGEISKNQLLLNKLELLKLKQQIDMHKGEYLQELSNLQAFVDNTHITDVACNDMIEITRDIKLNAIEEHGEIKKLSYDEESAKASYEVNDAIFQSIGYELMYEKELDASLYTFGISIPLYSLTNENENKKVQYLHMNKSISAAKDTLTQEIKSESYSLQLKIQTLFDEYTLVKYEVLPLTAELLKLSKSALIEGEGSVMEYLHTSRSYSQNMLEVLQIKKNYYNQLFELYKKADLDFGDNHENIN